MDSGIEHSEVGRICLPFLREAQNPDGGWGFRPGTPSRVEGTCWALLALWEPAQQAAEDQVRIQNALSFLQTAQLGDGSWPAAPGEETGCWVTSLCCLVLAAVGGETSNSATEAGLQWICDDWPSDSTPWRRFLSRLSSRRELAPINYSYRGWGWTPGTSSWVEPTSFGLLALERIASPELGAKAKRRRSLATSLLFDRMCPGGGWNAGNPVVYGAAGVPTVIPTVWSLLALRSLPLQQETTLSLAWLERTAASIESPGSAALARICLKSYGRAWPSTAMSLNDQLQKSGFLENTLVAAWSVLAAGPDFWLGKSQERRAAA